MYLSVLKLLHFHSGPFLIPQKVAKNNGNFRLQWDLFLTNFDDFSNFRSALRSGALQFEKWSKLVKNLNISAVFFLPLFEFKMVHGAFASQEALKVSVFLWVGKVLFPPELKNKIHCWLKKRKEILSNFSSHWIGGEGWIFF